MVQSAVSDQHKPLDNCFFAGLAKSAIPARVSTPGDSPIGRDFKAGRTCKCCNLERPRNPRILSFGIDRKGTAFPSQSASERILRWTILTARYGVLRSDIDDPYTYLQIVMGMLLLRMRVHAQCVHWTSDD